MATSAVITIIDRGLCADDCIYLYRHYDSDVPTVFKDLKKAMGFTKRGQLDCGDLAAAICRAWKPKEGGHIYIASSPDIMVDFLYTITPYTSPWKRGWDVVASRYSSGSVLANILIPVRPDKIRRNR